MVTQMHIRRPIFRSAYIACGVNYSDCRLASASLLCCFVSRTSAGDAKNMFIVWIVIWAAQNVSSVQRHRSIRFVLKRQSNLLAERPDNNLWKDNLNANSIRMIVFGIRWTEKIRSTSLVMYRHNGASFDNTPSFAAGRLHLNCIVEYADEMCGRMWWWRLIETNKIIKLNAKSPKDCSNRPTDGRDSQAASCKYVRVTSEGLEGLRTCAALSGGDPPPVGTNRRVDFRAQHFPNSHKQLSLLVLPLNAFAQN